MPTGRTPLGIRKSHGPTGINTPIPSYNDADQVTTTTSTNPAGQGYTTTTIYDGTTSSATIASLTFTPRALINTMTFQTTSNTGLASEQFSYDANLRPTSSSASWLSGSGSSGTILSQSRNYDAASNVTSLSTTLAAVPGASNSGGSEVQNFCDDEQNKLVWAGNSGTQPGAGTGTCGSGTLATSLNGAGYGSSYVSTHLGQLWQGPLNGTGTQQQYLYCDSSHPHQLTGLYQAGSTCSSKQGQSYTSSYDAWGNVSSRTTNGTTTTLSSDGLDQFVKWDAGSSGQEQSVYDAAGRRVLRRSTSSTGSTTMTVYAFGLEEHLSSGAGVNQGNTYDYTLGGHLVGESTGSNTTMFLTDALGSVITTLSATANSAAVQGNQAYGPYGNARYQAGSLGTAKGFTGQYQDSTGLDYYNARYYDPVVGRFLSADIIEGNLGGMDPYAYVQDNPETNSDPTGDCVPGNVCQGNTSSPTNSCGDATSQAGCGLFGAWYAFHLPDGGQVPIPGIWCVWCHEGSDSGNPAEEDGAAFDQADLAEQHLSEYFDDRPGAGDTPDESRSAVAQEGESSAAAASSTDGTRPPEDGETTLRPDTPPPDQPEVSGRPKPLLARRVGGDGACSFTFSTVVRTEHGEQAIGTLQVGERVLAYNPKTGKMEDEPILHVWINHDNDLVDLTITTTRKGEHGKAATTTSEVVHTNQKHPFFTIEQGFVPVG